MKCSLLAAFGHVTVKCKIQTYLKSVFKISSTCSDASLNIKPECFVDDQLIIWLKYSRSLIKRLQLGDVMNPAAIHMLLQLPPDPVVYWADWLISGLLAGQGVGAMKSGVSRFTVFHVTYVQERLPVSNNNNNNIHILNNNNNIHISDPPYSCKWCCCLRN